MEDDLRWDRTRIEVVEFGWDTTRFDPLDFSWDAARFEPVEFSWDATLFEQVELISGPSFSPDFALRPPTSLDETPFLSQPAFHQCELDTPRFETINLLQPLGRPNIDGTIFVKKQEELFQQGRGATKVTVEPQDLRRIGIKQPRGLNIFELLLPVLMPPAATEFSDELLFPQELYPFQRAGVKRLFETENALLADDMGLGKTVQAITAFRALIRRSKALYALVICPKSVVQNWLRELERWAPELVSIAVQGPPDARRILWQAHLRKCHVLVTTYDLVRQDHDLIKTSQFDLVVADEVQRIKNPGVKAAQTVRNLNAKRRWALTGTPLENDVQELVAIFNFILPGLFRANEKARLSALPREVRERIRPHVLRRRKEEALPELPGKVFDTKWLELSENQRAEYDRVEKQGTEQLKTTENVTLQHVFALIQKLKQICNFAPTSGESAKFEYLIEDYLAEACIGDQKVIIISQYVQTLDNIYRRLKGYQPLRYTGQLSTAERTRIENYFQFGDTHKVLLLSLRAGGVGINLTRANYVVHFDRWWNPAVERQAEDRTHRIGQLKTVFVTRFICKDTIEEKIERILERKRILFNDVIDELADVNLERTFSEEELFGLFGLSPPRRLSADQAPRSAYSEGSRSESVVAEPEVNETASAAVIRPDKPFSNLVLLRNTLRDSEEFINWADLHFSARGLEELIDILDPARVRSVKILSGPANANERAKKDFQRFCDELVPKGILAEWRILPGFAHDRWIISKNACYNVPPINSLLKGDFAELLETPNRPPFDDWWNKAAPI
ncbi:MAG: DEAD/DEAH box helicase [Candidatus Binataceae bacterium]